MSAELHTLVGAFALDALGSRQRAAFEHHLDSCPTCAGELAEFRATTARLADAVAAEPPPRLREQVLAAAARTPQQRPVVTVVPLSRWRRYSSTALVAAAAVAVVTVGALYVGERNRGDQLEGEQQQVAAIMDAPDRVETPATDDAPVHVVSSASLDQAVVTVTDLPRITDAESYELWAIGPKGAPRSIGVMPTAAESGTELVDALDDAATVAVTVEQAGGSPTGQPTSDPVEAIDLV